MDKRTILESLYKVRSGELSPEEMLLQLKLQPFEDLGFAKIDTHRALRQGMARGAGYVFATSNCVYTGMSLARYALMQDIWWREGIYPGPEAR